MFTAKPRISAGILAALLIGLFAQSTVQGQDKEKSGKSPATIKVLVPDTKVELKIEGTPTKAKGEERVFKTPPLEEGKTYQYKIESVIEPNNYTKIIRNREITFKAGETVIVDIRNKDDKIPDDVRIRWVPTPEDIVEEMARMAKIGKDDIVFDLGCGDAIMIATAVKKFGAKKGVGIDIDPKMVAKAKETAKDKGVEDKLEIREGNILKLDKKDIGECTVMMLYLGDEMNIRLRPMLWEHLKPGTRIVSHRFTMGDWKPEITKKVMGADGDEYELHLWIIPEKKKDEPKKEEKKETKKDDKK